MEVRCWFFFLSAEAVDISFGGEEFSTTYYPLSENEKRAYYTKN
jgi:hypothetical protein